MNAVSKIYMHKLYSYYEGINMIKLIDLSQSIVDYSIQKGAEYVDIRIQKIYRTLIDVRNSKILDCYEGLTSGVGIRVIVDGSWGFASTNLTDLTSLKDSAESAIRLAKRRRKLSNPIKLANIVPIEDRVPLDVKEDPRIIPLDEKADLIRDLNKRTRELDKRIVNVRTLYTDSIDSIVFRNSEGTSLEMTLPNIETNFWVVSREHGISQGVRNRRAGSIGFEFTKEVDLEEQGRSSVEKSIDLVRGEATPSGKITVIMDPGALGVFIHEAFGHANEADSVLQGRSFLLGRIGEQIASEDVTMYSDPTIKGAMGSYPYDSEGTPGKKTILIDEGNFKSYMHSRETAGKYEAEPTGNARAQNYALPPIVRQNNLYLKPGKWSLDEIIESTKYGILIEGSRGGMEDPDRGGFQVSAQNCYLIENGEIVNPLRDVSISGMTIETFKSIDAVADDFSLWPGHCGKGEPGVAQSIGTTCGGPHIRVRDILVGGSR